VPPRRKPWRAASSVRQASSSVTNSSGAVTAWNRRSPGSLDRAGAAKGSPLRPVVDHPPGLAFGAPDGFGHEHLDHRRYADEGLDVMLQGAGADAADLVVAAVRPGFG